MLLTVEEEKAAHEAGKRHMEHMLKHLDKFGPSYISYVVIEAAIKAVERMREEQNNADESGN